MQNRILCYTAIAILLASTVAVSVFAVDGSGDEASDSGFLQVALSEHQDISSRDDVVFVDSSNVDVDDPSFAEYLDRCLDDGMNVITDDARIFDSMRGIRSMSFDANADVYAMYGLRDSSKSLCLSVISDDERFIAECLADWLNQPRAGFDGEYNLAMCVNETIAGGSGSNPGSVRAVTTYYNYNQGDPRYVYYYAQTHMEVRADAFWNRCNNIDYIHSEYEFVNPDLVLMGADVHSGYGDIGHTIGAEVNLRIGYQNESDFFDGRVDMTCRFPEILTLSPLEASADIQHYSIVDSYGSDSLEYSATEKHTVGFQFLSPYRIGYNVELEAQTSVLPML